LAGITPRRTSSGLMEQNLPPHLMHELPYHLDRSFSDPAEGAKTAVDRHSGAGRDLRGGRAQPD